MKRTILIALLTMICCGFASSALAAKITLLGGGTSIGNALYLPSTGVTVNLVATAQSYCATAQHSSATDAAKGAKQYGTLSGDSVIKSANANDSGEPNACTSASALPSAFATGQ